MRQEAVHRERIGRRSFRILERGQVHLAIRNRRRTELGEEADVVSMELLLAVPELERNVVRVEGAQNARNGHVVGVLSVRMRSPDDTAAGGAASQTSPSRPSP